MSLRFTCLNPYGLSALACGLPPLQQKHLKQINNELVLMRTTRTDGLWPSEKCAMRKGFLTGVEHSIVQLVDQHISLNE